MAEDGRRELPRPPRRVPPAAQQQTVLEPARVASGRGSGGSSGGSGSGSGPGGSGGTTQYEPPLPPRFRFRFLVPLIVFVLVLGLGAGWLVREDSLGLDIAKVEAIAKPSVVRVLATTCAGTGEATGVLLANGLILTAASAIRQPMSIAIMTDGGRIRPANPLGSSSDGVALLKVVGRLDEPTAELAPKEPADRAERATLGYKADGKQALQEMGTAKDPRPLSEVLTAPSWDRPCSTRQAG